LPWVYIKKNREKKKIRAKKIKKNWSLKKMFISVEKKKINSFTVIPRVFDSRKEGWQFINVQ